MNLMHAGLFAHHRVAKWCRTENTFYREHVLQRTRSTENTFYREHILYRVVFASSCGDVVPWLQPDWVLVLHGLFSQKSSR